MVKDLDRMRRRKTPQLDIKNTDLLIVGNFSKKIGHQRPKT